MTSLQKHRLGVWLQGGLMRFATWLQGLPNRGTPPPFRLLQIGSAFWQSRVLYVAARLDIATLLADDTLAADEIARRAQADPDACYRLLRMLAAMGVFEEAAPRRFRNNRLSAHLRSDHPQSVRDLILMHNSPEMSRPWYEQLERGVTAGEAPFRLTHGDALFDFMDKHAGFDALFARAMDSVEALTGDSFATDFDWGRFERIIDIGGSKGSKSLAILKRHPKLRALVVDRPQVVRAAEGYWQGGEDDRLLSRLDFMAGDVLGDIPAAQSDKDIYLLSAVLHGFDDASCVRILKNLAGAAGRDALIAVMELVMPESGADLAGASFDMQMFMGTSGRERTLGEWQIIFERSGLQLQETVALRTFGSILVLRARRP
jgi:hypothetical protein